MRFVVSGTLAVLVFAAIAVFPWFYWEVPRLVMREEAPAEVAWLVSKGIASLVWWGMGIGLVVWLPLSLALASGAGYLVFILGISLGNAVPSPTVSQLALDARRRAHLRSRERAASRPKTASRESQ